MISVDLKQEEYGSDLIGTNEQKFTSSFCIFEQPKNSKEKKTKTIEKKHATIDYFIEKKDIQKKELIRRGVSYFFCAFLEHSQAMLLLLLNKLDRNGSYETKI